VQRQVIVGNLAQYPTESAAQGAADSARLDINKENSVAAQQPTLSQLIEHYNRLELGDDSYGAPPGRGVPSGSRTQIQTGLPL
jgi:hypothetical protein